MIMHKNKTCRPKIMCRAIVNGRQNEYRKNSLSEVPKNELWSDSSHSTLFWLLAKIALQEIEGSFLWGVFAK